jgi:hypothetical protein
MSLAADFDLSMNRDGIGHSEETQAFDAFARGRYVDRHISSINVVGCPAELAKHRIE